MKAYKVEVLIIGHHDIEADDIIYNLENSKYIHPKVMKIEEAEIGKWDDDHPLNKRDSLKSEYERLFNKTGGGV